MVAHRDPRLANRTSHDRQFRWEASKIPVSRRGRPRRRVTNQVNYRDFGEYKATVLRGCPGPSSDGLPPYCQRAAARHPVLVGERLGPNAAEASGRRMVDRSHGSHLLRVGRMGRLGRSPGRQSRCPSIAGGTVRSGRQRRPRYFRDAIDRHDAAGKHPARYLASLQARRNIVPLPFQLPDLQPSRPHG